MRTRNNTPANFKWFLIPPYNNEAWHVSNFHGEHIATFESYEDAAKVVKLFNKKKEG